jgi:HEAT repeat protein
VIRFRFPTLALIALAMFAVAARPLPAADDAGDAVVDAIIDLVRDKDKDLRAVGLEQVREQAKGAAATRRFAAALPKLAPEAQAGLLDALADRGDREARPAALAMLKSKDVVVRAAALRALGALGDANDVATFVAKIAAPSAPESAAATAALTRLLGPKINAAIISEVKSVEPKKRAKLLGILAARGAKDAVPCLLASVEDADAGVRAAALDALGQLAQPDHLPAMVRLALKAPDKRQAEAVQNAIVLACGRVTDPSKRADQLLAVYATLDDKDKQILLPMIGRLGGPAALKIVETAIAGADPRWREAGTQALCNWPDGSVAMKLLELSKTAADAGQRRMALLALIRVAPLPDGRSPTEKLRMLKLAMDAVARDQDRELILKRVQAIRTIDALHYVASYLKDSRLSQQACATVVELAHHRELREPNKREFDRLLDQVIRISKDPVVVERAKRYKLGQTYYRTPR